MRTGKAVGLALAGIALVAVVVGGAWFLRVGTSEIRGEGDAVVQRNSAANWTSAQARFESLYAEVVAQDKTVAIAKERLDADPTDRTAQQNYDGARMICANTVGAYNAEARSYLSEDFRAADLPAQIGALDSTTDCEA